MPTVYLDTNVFIDGAKRPEHYRLKNLAIEGRIRLFIGPEVSREIRQQISNLGDERHEVFVSEGKYTLNESAELLKVIGDKIKMLEERLRSELGYWKDAKPERPHNTFEGLMLAAWARGIEYALSIDLKGEIRLVSSLQRDFKIKLTDAFHLMQAHSSRLDYFLSWDKRQLINRARRVPWLIPRAMTPDDFLADLDN